MSTPTSSNTPPPSSLGSPPLAPPTVPPPTPSSTPPPPTPLFTAIHNLYEAKRAHKLTTYLIAYLRAQIYYMHHLKLDLQFRYWHSVQNPERQGELQTSIDEWRVLLKEGRCFLKKAGEIKIRQWTQLERARTRVATILMKEYIFRVAEMYLALIKSRRGG
ncbi:uncharacterized protein LAJ45_04653 [Morchella importuna]|uniref:uncharacterized protein n=1 Tax=Morchella importuna TaxID=1174673 RepID=UPI001E8D92B9|nr:uncharacterized protein LAJ45_04653 [Morchella importuna]KAH8151448.1 hypothetical protein LAJ45_04653 [Morchella importuna]